MAELKASRFVFKKKTSNLILPYSESNDGRDDLIKLTVEEAIDMGLIGKPNESSTSSSEHDDLRMKLIASVDTISEMNVKLAELAEENAQLTKLVNNIDVETPKKVTKKKSTKKVAAKKKATVKEEPQEIVDPVVANDELSNQLNQMGLELG